mgnify:CR=1 FL=1
MSVKSKGLTVPDKNAADGANRGIRKYIRHNWQLWIMLFPAMLYILIFCYVPMYGIQLAFREELRQKGIIKYNGGKTEFMYRGLLDGVDMAMDGSRHDKRLWCQ